MKISKKIIAAAFALTMCLGITACGGSSSGNTSSQAGNSFTKDQEKKVDDLKSKLPDKELKDKTVTWFAHYDINPGKNQPANAGLTLFKEKYGGSVAYKKTTWDNRYTDLTKYTLTSDAPDFFPADDMDAFPKGAIKNMFDPIDDYVDLNSDIWKSSKTVSDSFIYGGKHYVAAKGVTPRYVCIYNTKTIEDNQLDDPAELYEDDEWTFDKFAEMCEEFTDKTKKKYGLDGYFYSMALNDICGVPLISVENGKIVNNLENPRVAKIQEKMYQLQKKDVCFPRSDNGWKPRGNGDDGDGIGSNLTLFEPIGLYAIENTPEKTKLFGSIKDGEVMFVPMPRMDDDDTYYSSAKVEGYLLCHNAKNPEGFGALMDCFKVANDTTEDIYYEQLKNDYQWTDDMIEMRKKVVKLTEEHPVFDFSYGISTDMKDLMENHVNNATMITGGNTMTWTKTVQTYNSTVDKYIADCNQKLK